MEKKRNNWQTAPWDIRPSDGIGPLMFGMSLAEVQQILGWEVKMVRDDPKAKQVFFVGTLALSLFFDPGKDSLYGINFFSDELWVSVNGEILVAEPWRVLVEQLGIHNGGTYVTDDRGIYNFENLRIGIYDEDCGDDGDDNEHRAVNLSFDDGVTKLWK